MTLVLYKTESLVGINGEDRSGKNSTVKELNSPQSGEVEDKSGEKSSPSSELVSGSVNITAMGEAVVADSDKKVDERSNKTNDGEKSEDKKNGKGPLKRKLGRRGDPRMHRAVAARLNNPQISLLDALLEGGFEFPNMSDDKDKGSLNGQIADTDNVQLCQRKNQLSRRLRLARQVNNQNTNHQQTEKSENDEELSNEENSGLNSVRKRSDKGGKRKHSVSSKDTNIGTKRRSSYTQDPSVRDESNPEVSKRRSSILSLQNQSGMPQSASTNNLNSLSPYPRSNQFPTGYHHRPSFSLNSSNKLHNPYINASSSDLLSSLKASSLPTSLALQQQHLLLQRQAALQDSSSLSISSNHGNQYPHASGPNINDINANPDRSLYLTPSAALNDIEHAIRQQQEMARIVATAKIFANSARKGPLSSRESFSGSAHLRHSLTGGVLQGDLMESAHSIDDDASLSFVPEEEKHAENRGARRLSNSSAAIAHAHHLNQNGAHATPASILRSSITAGSQPSNSSSSSTKAGSAISSNGKSTTIDHAKMKIALDYFRADNASLMKRCLLMAGFDGPQTEECSPLYLEFLSNVIKVEQQRLSHLCNFKNSDIGEENPNSNKSTNSSGNTSPTSNGNANESNRKREERNSFEQESSQSQQRRASTESVLKRKNGDFPKRRSSQIKSEGSINQRTYKQQSRYKNGCFKGRHIHRLAGKCGHKAVIHRPRDAPAHVDFVVNGKVECYQHTKPYIPAAKNGTALWPSQYRNEELGCKDQETIKQGESVIETESEEISRYACPKILDDVDLNDDEMFLNLPDGKEDDVLMGLIGLGE